MNGSFHFTSLAHWTGPRHGVVEGKNVEPIITFSAPPEFQGESGVWTPEHFLTAAVATCFISTFEAVANYSKFPAKGLQVSVDGQLERVEGGYRFTRVTIKPVLTILKESDRERGIHLLEKAEKVCLISRSLNSEIVLVPQVAVAPAEVAL